MQDSSIYKLYMLLQNLSIETYSKRFPLVIFVK